MKQPTCKKKHKWIKIVLSILTVVVITSCSQYRIYTRNISGKEELRHEGILYALPLTTLKINVHLTKITFQKGPFAAYADKYLGLENVLTENHQEWQINTLSIVEEQEIDPGQYYFIGVKRDPKHQLKDLLSWSEQGFYIDFYKQSNTKQQLVTANPEKEEPDAFLHRMAFTENLSEQIDTLYETVFQDSVFVKVPVLHKQMVEKTIEQKARETADLIINLRQAKISLLANPDEFMPDADYLTTTINEIEKQEELYMRLFTGRKTLENHTRVFELTPEKKMLDTTTLLFKFDSKEGIIPITSSQGEEVMSTITKKNKTRTLHQLLTTRKRSSNVIYYRIPELCEITISNRQSELISQKVLVNQFGAIVKTPVGYLLNEE
jgi:hypothetical protein